MTTWAAEEFGGAELGDGRLNRRLIKLAATFADKPTASIPGACPDWSETQAVYRFFDQASTAKRALGWQDILDGDFRHFGDQFAELAFLLDVQPAVGE